MNKCGVKKIVMALTINIKQKNQTTEQNDYFLPHLFVKHSQERVVELINLTTPYSYINKWRLKMYMYLAN